MKNKIVVVRQRDIKDCGPCCLLSIIKYYNGYVSLEKIREDTYTSLSGTSVYHLLNAAKDYGFDVKAKKYLDKNLNSIIIPAIVHVKYENGLTHFMVLYKISDKHLILMDPSKGKVKMDINNFNDIFTGVVIELFPKNEIIYLEKESSIFSLFNKIIKSNKNLCLIIISYTIFLTLFTILYSLNFKIIYQVLSNASVNYIKFTIYLFFIILIFKIILTFMKNYYENYLTMYIDTDLYEEFISHIFYLPSKIISSRSTGEIMTRVNELCDIKNLFTEFITSFINILLLFGSFFILLFINKTLCLILCLLYFIYMLIIISINPYLYKKIRKNIEYETKLNSSLVENIDMFESIKNINIVDNIIKSLEKKVCMFIYDNFDIKGFMNLMNLIKNTINELGLFIINIIGFIYIYQNKMTFLDLVTFNTVLEHFINPINNITLLITKYNFLRASFNKIMNFMDLEKEEYKIGETFVNGDIKFDNVSFSYNDYYFPFKNLNLLIKKGEKVIINGKSGTGKSTMCKLLLGNYQLKEGNIFVNNKNILNYNIYTLRKNITYVGQKENIYSETLKNNILFFRKESNVFDDICKICIIDDIASKKAFYMDFNINNDSNNISGGEKQRIILARALINAGDIIILDEALSEVDYLLERKIIKNIINYFPLKTIIYISHKKQNDLFDRVITLKENSYV